MRNLAIGGQYLQPGAIAKLSAGGRSKSHKRARRYAYAHRFSMLTLDALTEAHSRELSRKRFVIGAGPVGLSAARALKKQGIVFISEILDLQLRVN
jgi:NADPH-dependent 2,4-dienoyl-CoA reductase/sulfur reductase-like enzyme